MLAEDYANRFKVESLGVYDALKAVWAHTNNNSEFVIPSKVSMWQLWISSCSARLLLLMLVLCGSSLRTELLQSIAYNSF